MRTTFRGFGQERAGFGFELPLGLPESWLSAEENHFWFLSKRFGSQSVPERQFCGWWSAEENRSLFLSKRFGSESLPESQFCGWLSADEVFFVSLQAFQITKLATEAILWLVAAEDNRCLFPSKRLGSQSLPERRFCGWLVKKIVFVSLQAFRVTKLARETIFSGWLSAGEKGLLFFSKRFGSQSLPERQFCGWLSAEENRFLLVSKRFGSQSLPERQFCGWLSAEEISFFVSLQAFRITKLAEMLLWMVVS